VREPELAADLTAETFAAALIAVRDVSHELPDNPLRGCSRSRTGNSWTATAAVASRTTPAVAWSSSVCRSPTTRSRKSSTPSASLIPLPAAHLAEREHRTTALAYRATIPRSESLSGRDDSARGCPRTAAAGLRLATSLADGCCMCPDGGGPVRMDDPFDDGGPDRVLLCAAPMRDTPARVCDRRLVRSCLHACSSRSARCWRSAS
jgi:hypothetical protein